MIDPEIKVFPDPAAVAQEAADRFVGLAEASIALAERFTVALSGGSTPLKMFDVLTRDPHKSAVDWARVEVFFADERCVPPDHPESNYRAAREGMLAKLPIPGDNIYRMRGEIDPNEAAKEYGLMLKEKFGDNGGLDLVLLGMGADGHTASLFPGTPALSETKHRCVAQFVERSTTGPSWRVTLTAPFINRARDVLFLVTGAEKAARLSEVLEGPKDPQRLPAQLIAPAQGKLSWLLDAAAAGMTGEE